MQDLELLHEVGALLDVHLQHPEAVPLGARDVRDDAFHAPGRAGTGRREEDEQGLGVVGQGF
jgi:hypothetical protein